MARKVSSSDIKKFIAYIAPMIQREGFSRGYAVVSTTIGQAIKEGAAGQSTLAKTYHNHFGLKCGKAWLKAGKPSICLKTKEEYTPGTLTDIKDFFRVFPDDESGVEGYYDFISAPRYDNLRTAKNYRQFAEYLKADGYATSSTYVESLCRDYVERYNLDKWDDKAFSVSYYPKYTGDGQSIVNALNSLGIPSDLYSRRNIYNANFSDTYTMSAKQNISMLDLLKQGVLIMP